MHHQFDITDREKLSSVLSKLRQDASPAWGKLDAQGMVEHLIEAIQYTNGKQAAHLAVSAEEAAVQKEISVNDSFEIPHGTEGYLSDAMLDRKFSDLPAAITRLHLEIDAFRFFFREDKRTAIHPAFGPMNRGEWTTWHNKHFTHHFKQFGLLDDSACPPTEVREENP